MHLPLVSVVITTKNEEKNIKNCLASIVKQSYPQNQIEIIIIDNNSTDKTKEIASQFTPHIFNYGPERSAQRNYGAKKSKGEYFLYLDCDMILDSNVIEECVKKVELKSTLIGLYIPEIIMGQTFWSKVRRFERSFYTSTVIDCVRFIRMNAFHDIKGFDETMSGPEDWDFDKKIRLKGIVDTISSPVYHNETEFNLQRYLNKKGYYIKSFNKYIQKWGENDPDIRKQLGIYYRFVGVFIENGKWKKLLRHPILTCGMLLLKFLVGLTYLSRKKSISS